MILDSGILEIVESLLLMDKSTISRFDCTSKFKFKCRGAGTYLNILWTNQVCLKFDVDKIQKCNIFMSLHSKIGYFQGLFPKYSVDKSPCPHTFQRPCTKVFE